MTLKNLHNATSLQGSVDGAMQHDLLGGQTTDQCGQVAHHASHFQQPGIEKEKTTSDTSGQSSSISSASANLQSSLESRLRQQLEWAGSTIYKQTWKQKVTPAGWSYYQLAASVLRIKETDSSTSQSGWATPNTMDYMALRSDEALLRQATTTRKGRSFPANLREQVDPRSQEIYATHQIPQAAWATPNTRDWKDTPGQTTDRENGRKRFDQVPRQAFGMTTDWHTVETESTDRSQLNPRFSLWLMGYPIEWAYSGERVTLLSRKSVQK